jgi:hypothetical protein
MPLEPIEYRIVQSLQTALRGIATASGYHHTVQSLAVKLDPNVDVETLIGDEALRPFMVLELPPDQHAIKFAPKGVQITLPVIVHAVHASDPTIDESWIRTYFRLCADVEFALAQDISRGGLAVDTRVLSREAVSFSGEQVWAKVTAQVTVVRRMDLPNG